MSKQFKQILLVITSMMIFTGCTQTTTEEKSNNKMTISYEKLSDREMHLTTVTGNKVVMYNIDNIPINQNYEFQLIYEEYEKGEKTKEEIIAQIRSDEDSPKSEDMKLTINCQSDSIRYVADYSEGFCTSQFKVDEKLENMFQRDLMEESDFDLGDEIYIYEGSTGKESGNGNYTYDHIELGEPIDDNKLKEIIKENDKNVFLKIVYKELNK